jgi:O-antigen ligase
VPPSGTGGGGSGLRRAGLAALVVAAAALPLQGLRVDTGAWLLLNESTDRAGGVLVSDVLLVLAGSVGAVQLVRRRGWFPEQPGLLGLGALLLVSGGLLGLVAAEQRGTSAALLARAVAAAGLCVVAVWGVRPARRERAVLVSVYVGAAAVSALAGLVAVVGGSAGNVLQNAAGRAVGLAGNAGALAMMSAVALAMVLVLALETVSQRQRLVLVAAGGVLVAGLLASGSRGPFLSMALLSLLALVRAFRTDRRRLLAVSLVALVLLLGLLATAVRTPTTDRLFSRPGAPSETASASATLRFDQVARSVEDRGAWSLLIGSGLRDDEPTPRSVAQGDLRDPHSGHLEVWLGLGLMGLVGWGAVAWTTIAPGARLLAGRRRLAGPELEVAVVAAGFAAFVLSDFTVNNVWNRYIWVLVAVGALVQAHHQQARR